MAKTTRLVKSFYRLLFPVAVLIVLAVGGGFRLACVRYRPTRTVRPTSSRRTNTASSVPAGRRSPKRPGRTATARRHAAGCCAEPTVHGGILLHKYGADRSMFDLGVKLNESTNFTVLMPDQRGHGDNPAVPDTLRLAAANRSTPARP